MNQVNVGGNGPNRQDEYQEAHQTYVVFVTEATDKKILQRRAMEVNAMMPAVPKFMHWSEQEINWSRQDNPRVMPTREAMLWWWTRPSWGPPLMSDSLRC